MNIFKKASDKAKQFFKDVSKQSKSVKKTIVAKFKKEYKVNKSPSSFEPGTLVTFKYNAIDATKKFDKSPLCLMLGLAKDNKKHCYGLNVHWMPQNQRVLLASLITEMLDKKGGKLDYKDVKPLIKKFEGSPILRRYAIRRVSQKVIQMPKDMYLAAASISFPEWSGGD